MFYARYIPWAEREWLSHEFFDLRYGTETVTEITHMFTKRMMFCAEFASEQA